MLSAQNFASFNENLFYNKNVVDDMFVPLENDTNVLLTVSEVQ